MVEETSLKSRSKSAPDLTGFGGMVAQLRRFTRAFDKAYPEVDQDYALRKLLWCLNAGGRREYAVTERPDRAHRRELRPDYVCGDRVTGTEITIEVTRIFLDCDAPEEENLRMDILSEVALLVESHLQGTYHVVTPEYLPMRGIGKQEAIATLVEAILRSKGDLTPTFLPYGCVLDKTSDHGSALVFGATLEEKLTSDWEIETKLDRALEHGNGKLDAYCRGVGIVLVDCFFFLDPLNVWEGRIQVAAQRFPSVERLFILNREPWPRITRIW